MQRSNIEKWFRQEADIFYLQSISDGYGGFKQEWVRKYYRVMVRIYGSGGGATFTIKEQGVDYNVEKKLLCGLDINIEKGDRVTCGDDVYIVLRSDTVQALDANHTECLLGRLEE